MEKLNRKQFVTVLIAYSLGIIYILTDQLFVPKNIRLAALLVVFIIMFVTLFILIKTEKPLRLSNKLALILLFFVWPMYLIQDILINHNYTLKPVMVGLTSFVFPYLIGFVFMLFRKKS